MKENPFALRGRGFVVIWIVFYLIVLLSPQLKILRGNSDFLAKYTAAQVVLSGQGAHLYHFETQKQVQSKILLTLNSDVKFAGDLLLFSHPPFVALLYVVVAWLSYVQAFLAWNLISVVCLFTGIGRLVRYCQIESSSDLELLGLSCLIFMPVSAALLQGQSTSAAFLCLVLAFLDLKRCKEFRGGLWLSLVLMKFQVLPLLVLVLLFKKRWQALLGFFAGGLCLAAASLLVVGPEGVLGYLALLKQMSGWVNLYGVNPIGANCLRGQMYLLFYPTLPNIALAMTFLFSLAFVTLTLVSWRQTWDPQSNGFDLRFALVIVVGLLIAPQVNFHDLVFLLIPGVILVQFANRKLAYVPVGWTLFAVAFPLQILNFIVLPIIPIQLNVVGLILLTAVLFDAIRLSKN